MNQFKFNTSLLHHISPDPLTGAISTPIYQTSTFVQEAPGIHQGFDYSRSNNPTRQVLEQLLAHIEEGDAGFAFSSGLAAIDAVVKLLNAGDEILACDDIYGGSFRLFTHIYQKFGINVRYVDSTDVANVVREISCNTKMVWIESPTNPTLKISDIRAISAVAHSVGAWLVVDNTFASPALQQPLTLGADIVIHSATKYLGGHSDLIAGAVITATQSLSERIKFIQNASGAVLGPFDSWLLIRGIETLPLRVDQHCRNAIKVAAFLETRPEVSQCFFPGLSTHTNHTIAARQQSGPGSIISFRLQEDTCEAAAQFVQATKLFRLAESLGGVKSLICHPATMTHKSIPETQRRQASITDSLIRLSVGIEDAHDLIRDLTQAFETLNKSTHVSPLTLIESHV